jgi:hypothetical protein
MGLNNSLLLAKVGIVAISFNSLFTGCSHVYRHLFSSQPGVLKLNGHNLGCLKIQAAP